jgi:hypothetical protein
VPDENGSDDGVAVIVESHCQCGMPR